MVLLAFETVVSVNHAIPARFKVSEADGIPGNLLEKSKQG